jgi:hypothetical protein
MRPSQSGSTDKVSPQRRLRFWRDAVHESVVEMDLTPTDGSDFFSRIELCALRRLDGRRLLSEAGMQTMLANHIGDLRVPVLKTVAPPLTADVDILPGTRKSHGIAFMRFRRRRARHAQPRIARLGRRAEHPTTGSIRRAISRRC